MFAIIDDIIVYIENSTQSTKQYTKISEFKKVTEYKVNRKNYFYINNEQLENEILKFV